ncbi:MAG: glycosyltransferase family 4 protein [Ilumatobacter sp.]
MTDPAAPQTASVNALVVSPPSSVWGAQLYLLDQLPALNERGVELTLASPLDSPFAQEWRDRGHRVVDLPLELHEGLREPGSVRRSSPRRMFAAVAGAVRGTRHLVGVAKDFDLMYSFALRSHVEVTVAGRFARTPVALDLVNIVRPGMGRRVLRAASRFATLTVANSRASAAVLPDSAPVQIIHPGIDLDRFGAGDRDEALRSELQGGVDRPLVAIVGRLDVRKGIQVLVDAMTRLTGPGSNARLVVVGEAGTGPQEFADELRRRSDELLGDRVTFLGRRSDIPEIMRAVDVLVVASVAEPFGLTALEAQACRTAVVGTNSGGLVEFVEDGVTGVLVEPEDAAAMAAGLERILGDDELRHSIVEEAYRLAVPDRGIDAQADELADMYRRVAGRTGDTSVEVGINTNNSREELR